MHKEKNYAKYWSTNLIITTLGRCFDLLDSSYIDTLKEYYFLFKKEFESAGLSIPKNIDHPKDKGDKVLRFLDCALIEYMHKIIAKKSLTPFDSIRAAFIEGNPIYPGAGFNDKTHIQVCIRNPNCIKGIFLPRKVNKEYSRV